MKLWIKFLIGIGIGLISSVFFPINSVQSTEILNFVVDLVIRFGRYTLLPFLFFSCAVAFFRLRDEKMLLKTTSWTIGIIISSSFLMVILGLITALLVNLPRIPITTEKVNEVASFSWRNLFVKIFPYSGFEVLLDGAYLFPCFVFAGLAGAGAAVDKNASKAAMNLFESMSQVCYTAMSFFTEILFIGMIVVMCRWTMDFTTAVNLKSYNSLIVLLLVNLLIIAFVIYPLVLRFLCHDSHPYRVLYASLCPFIVAFFSGDTNLTLALNLRHGKESLGIKGRVNSFAYPLLSIFGRGGSIMVQTICFVLILRSYSSLGISFTDTIWIGGISFILSFALAEIPVGGPFVAITVMCMLYGRGFESGYLLLKNVAPIICAYAAGIDALTSMFGSYIIAVKTKSIQHQEIKKFI